MKRILSAVAASVLLAMTGCGGGDDNNNDPETLNITGRWTFTIVNTGNTSTWIMNLTQSGTSVTGTSTQANDTSNTAVVSGTVQDRTVTLTEAWSQEDGGDYHYSGTIISASSMSGTSDYESTWTAVKN